MRKRTNIYLIIKIMLILVIFTGSVGAKVLIVPAVSQEQTEWCWAAVSNAVFTYYGKYHPQCEIADFTRMVCTWHNFGPVDCCADPSQGCNYWNYMYGIDGSLRDILIHWGVNNYYNYTYLSRSQISNEIDHNRPFIFRWGWNTGGGHFLVGDGIDNDTIHYMNPWQGEGQKTGDYDWVVSGGSHTWTHTLRMTSNVNNVVIVLGVMRKVEKAWIVRGYYSALNFRVQNTGSKVISSYSVSRKVEGGTYREIADIPASEVVDGAGTYYDKFISPNETYYYRVKAKNSAGSILASSNPYPVGD